MGEKVPLRGAIVGAGLMGRWHAYYAARQRADVTAIVDTQLHVAGALREKHPRAQIFTDLESCLTNCAVDVVHICTPVATHVSLAATAINAGKHVLIEKPVASSLLEVRALLDLAERTGVHVCPVHQFPFQRGVRWMRANRQRLGELIDLTFVTCSAGGTERTSDERRELLFEILPHPLSLFQCILDIDLMQANLRLSRLTDDDLELHGDWGEARLRAIISLRGRPTRNLVTLTGDHGTAYADLFHGFAFIDGGDANRRAKLLQPFRYGGKLLLAAEVNLLQRLANREYAYPGLHELIADFYLAIGTGNRPPFTDAEILSTAATIDDLRRTKAHG